MKYLYTLILILFSFLSTGAQIENNFLPFYENSKFGIISSDSSIISEANFSNISVLDDYFLCKFYDQGVYTTTILDTTGKKVFEGNISTITRHQNYYVINRITYQKNIPKSNLLFYSLNWNSILEDNLFRHFAPIGKSPVIVVVTNSNKFGVVRISDEGGYSIISDTIQRISDHDETVEMLSKYYYSSRIVTDENIRETKEQFSNKIQRDNILNDDEFKFLEDNEVVNSTTNTELYPRLDILETGWSKYFLSIDTLEVDVINVNKITRSLNSYENDTISENISFPSKSQVELIKVKNYNFDAKEIVSDFVVIKSENRVNIINAKGNSLNIELDSISSKPFARSASGRLYKIFKKNKIGVYCDNGELVLSPSYYSVSEKQYPLNTKENNTMENLALITQLDRNGKYGLSSNSGEILPHVFDEMIDRGDKLFLVSDDMKGGFCKGLLFEPLKGNKPISINKWGKTYIMSFKNDNISQYRIGFMNSNGWIFIK